MFRRSLVVGLLLAVLLLATTPLQAQDIEEIPNPMAAHTVFIILIAGAFLVWAASFSMQTARNRSDQNKRQQRLLDERDRILDEIAGLEGDRESDNLDATRYKHRAKKLRGALARVVGRIRSTPGTKKKPA
jgi:hypothetical protein